MTAEWQEVSLGTLCRIQSGKSDTKDAVPDGPYAFFDRSKTIKRSSRYLRDCEALIIPGEGTEFLPRHFEGKFDLHQRAYALFDFSPAVDVRFLYYYLHHVADYFPKVAVGATVKSLRLRHFEQLPVKVTSLSEQKRIVAVLNHAFSAIDTARANAVRNTLNAQEFFGNYLSATFDGDHAGNKVVSLGSCVEFRNGLNFTKSSKGQTVKIVGVGDFRDEFWAPLDELQAVTLDGRLNEGDRLRDGDLLVVRSNGNVELIGRTVVAKGVGNEVISHSGFTIRIRQTEPRFDPAYLCYFLKSGGTRRKLIKGGTGTNIKSLNQGMLSRLQVPCPALARQRDIVDKLDQVSGKSRRLRDKYHERTVAVDALRRSTLSAAFNGCL